MPGKLLRSIFLFSLLPVLASSCSPLLHGAERAYLPDLRKSFFHGSVRINYYEFGRGKPLIFLHGFGGASYTWRHIYPALKQDHHIFLIDLKGFGLSERPRDGQYTPRDQAEIVASFLEEKNLKSVTLVGHSFGGAVALLTYFMANHKKPRIKSLILVDSAGYPESLPNFIKILRIPLLNILLPKIVPARLAVARVLIKSFYDDDKITDDMFLAYTYYNRLPGSDYAARKTAEQIVPENIDEVIRKFPDITVPVLLIWGYEDEIIPLAYGFKLHRAIPGSQMVSLKQCGHIPPEEKPRETGAAISAFLQSLSQ